MRMLWAIRDRKGFSLRVFSLEKGLWGGLRRMAISEVFQVAGSSCEYLTYEGVETSVGIVLKLLCPIKAFLDHSEFHVSRKNFLTNAIFRSYGGPGQPLQFCNTTTTNHPLDNSKKYQKNHGPGCKIYSSWY